MTSASLEKEGWIKQRSGKHTKRIYARLENEQYLCIYDNDDDDEMLLHNKQSDKIDITQCKIGYTFDKKTSFSIDEHISNKTYYFECDNAMDAISWLQILNMINETKAKYPVSTNNDDKNSDDDDDDDDDEDDDDDDIDDVKMTPAPPIQFIDDKAIDDMHMNALISFQLKNYEECQRILNDILKHKPDHPEAQKLFEHLVNKAYEIDDVELKINLASMKVKEKIQQKTSIIDRIDNALEIYYNFFPNATYKNDNNENKFKVYCREYFDDDEDEILQEINGSMDDCTLIKFDENDETEINYFPFEAPIDPQKRDKAIFNILKQCKSGKPPSPLFQFVNDKFGHILYQIDHRRLIYMKPRAKFIKTIENGFLRLNPKNQEKDIIELKIQWQLKDLIGISQHKKNNILSRDFAYLLIDSYYRYCITTEINIDNMDNQKNENMINRYGGNTFTDNMLMEITINNDDNNIDLTQYLNEEEYDTDSIMQDIDGTDNSNILNEIDDNNMMNNIQQHIYDEKQICYQPEVYGQVYWKKNNVIYKYINNVPSQLKRMHRRKTKEVKSVVVLFMNGIFFNEVHYKKYDLDQVQELQDLIKSALNDHQNMKFRFMSSNKFHWSLVKMYKGLKFFDNAFNDYKREICGPLTLKNIQRMDDNIFIFWLYIWSMSKVIKMYMQSGDITIPLQVDMMIIPNTYKNESNLNYIDNISERFNIHDHKFEITLCDPNNIDSISQNLETILKICTNNMKTKENRIIIIIDRRSRSEYFSEKHCDRIFGYKPPTKYGQIDKKHEILNAIWNTSRFVIPPPPRYRKEEYCGTKDNNFFVLSYFIRKKSQFFDLFDKDKDTEPDDENMKLSAILSEDESISSLQSLQSEKDIAFPTLTKSGPLEFVEDHDMRNITKLTSITLSDFWETIGSELIGSELKIDQHPDETSEYQALQNYIQKVLWYRKHDAVINIYLFYNKGYCRFEPFDLIRILPKFFNLTKIKNYHQMLRDFKIYHDKLWDLDDDVWMKYKKLYLNSKNAMTQKTINNEIEIRTQYQDKENIKIHCLWDKQKRIDNKNRKDTQTKLNEIEVIQNEKYEKIIRLKINLNKFIKWKSKDNGLGMIITEIKNDDYKKYSDIKENDLWSITYINDINVSEMQETNIQKLLNKMDKFNDYTKIKLLGGIFRELPPYHKDAKSIQLTIPLKKFLRLKTGKKHGKYRTKITDIINDDYGNAFKETGITKGWYIDKVNGVDVTNKDSIQFKILIEGIWNYSQTNIVRFVYLQNTLKPSHAKKYSNF